MFKKFLFFSFIAILLLCLTAGLVMNHMGEDLIKARIEKGLAAEFGATAKIFEVRFTWGWPLGLTIDRLSIERRQRDFSLEVRTVSVTLGLSDILFDRLKLKPLVTANFFEPKIVFRMKPSGPSQKGNGPKNWPTNPQLMIKSLPLVGDLASVIEIKNGAFEMYQDNELMFTTAGSDVRLNLESLQSNLQVDLKTILTPARPGFDYQIPLAIKSEISWRNDRIDLFKNKMKILSLDSELSASYDHKADTYEIHLKSNIEDLEKHPTTEASFPLRDWAGHLNLDLSMRGRWGTPLTMNGWVSLKNYQSYLQWGYGDLKLFGRFRGAMEARFDGAQNLKLKSLVWNIDATDLNILYGSFFRKPPNVRFLTQGSGDFMNSFYLKTAQVEFSNLRWSGQGFMTPQGISHFSFTVPEFPLQGLEGFMPVFSEKPMSGTAQFQGEIVNDMAHPQFSNLQIRPLKIQNLDALVNYKQGLVVMHGPLKGNFSLDIQGPWDKLNLWQSPMTVTGQIQAELPSLIVYTQQAPQNTTGAAVAPSFAFFPDSKLVNGMKLDARISTAEFQLDQLKLKGLRLSTTLSKGVLTGQGEIDNVFSGRVLLKKASVSLTENNPTVNWVSSFASIELKQFFENLFPQWSNLAFGSMTGEVTSSSPLPSSPQFLSLLKAKGQFNVRNGLLNTIPFDQMVKNLLSEAPGIGNHKPIYKNPEKMLMTGQFDVQNNSIALRQFTAITPHREEFNFDGDLDFHSLIHLSGKVYLTEAPVTPEYFRSHLDAQQRLPIPVTISGSVLKPDLRLEQKPPPLPKVAAKKPAARTVTSDPRKTSKSAPVRK